MYGETSTSRGPVMWGLLWRIKPLGMGPWFMVADFNVATWQHEHFILTVDLDV